MDPHRSHPRSSNVHPIPGTRPPAEYMPDSPHIYTPPWLQRRQNPLTQASPSPSNPTPPWFQRRENPPTQASPSPQQFYMLPPLEIISVPKQAKYLTVLPLDEDPVLRDHVPRAKGSKPKAKPHAIKVVPTSRPIALVTAHTPLSVPPPISAVSRTRPPTSDGERSAPHSPGSPEPSPYIHPGLATGLPRALGMRAFPIRAERPWRHGG